MDKPGSWPAQAQGRVLDSHSWMDGGIQEAHLSW